MNTEQNNKDPAAQYAESVESERAAWQAMQGHAPGSDERANAWRAWSEAIGRTNRAWRRLNASRVSPSWQQKPTAGQPERPRANA